MSRADPTEVLERHSAAAPVDLDSMAQEMGLGVRYDHLPHGISGKIVRDYLFPGNFRIVVNKGEPSRRQRFTLAHEIAHFVLHRDLLSDGLTDDTMYRSGLADEYERQANALAGKILLPARALREAYKTQKSLAALADLFDASFDAIRIRVKELHLAP